MDATGFLEEGIKYQRIAANAFVKNKFNYKVIYNFITLAAEKLLVAAYMNKRHSMPANHSFPGLIEELESTEVNLHDELIRGILLIDSFQSICSLDIFEIKDPTLIETQNMLKIIEDLKNFVLKQIDHEKDKSSL
jgi:HEPN domain-containing protein